MALKSRNKVSVAFSMSSMTDIVFLLLIFFMLTSTLITPNALKLLLPQSDHKASAQPVLRIYITEDLQYQVGKKMIQFSELEFELHQQLRNAEDPTVALNADRKVPIGEVVKVMNIAKNNKYKLILATQAE